jgi:hypothetical protein
MDDSYFMDVLDSRDKLVEHFSSLRLSNAFIFDNMVEELALFHELHDQKELFRCLDDFIKLYYMWMSYEFENVNLPTDSFNVSYFCNFALFQYFDGYLLLRGLMDS